ncbi:hypothetical protein NPS01_09390 [Nocardioides psychrotolerans]|uniref:Uncharacterized protein n=1 Tax=Nocardioides psychrotolerans TaxID=1005945 RepID=A0A1I3FRP9_9ACTN|nr:hypothetical protein [Nocardioides psychrotolerans]GEP37276.1 hypothetical protein NPS01_09390 [Nocardioides psychrotolerans]SFI13854.1 hypothetical protein SAMN05216561_105119 [Nocardioides psychrotolerans]
MTEKLRNLLHDRAVDVDFPPPDLDLLVRSGDRRVRRRRGLVAAGSLAALAVTAAVVVPALVSDDGTPDPAGALATDVLPTDLVSWADGSILHAGPAETDLGETIRAFVRTDVGYVVADARGRVLSVVGGEVTEVGTVDATDPRLVSDHDSSLVGWVDRSGEQPAFQVYDQDDDEIVLDDDSATRPGMSNLADDTDPAYFYAIDGDTAYWRDTRGLVAVDVATGGTTVVDARAVNGFDLIDVQAGVLAFYGQEGVELGETRGTARPLPGVLEGSGVLSPLATSYAPDSEWVKVVNRDGTDLSPSIPTRYFFSTVYEWVDEETVRVIALESEEASADLFSCSIATSSCTLLIDGAGVEGELQLPVGEVLGG